MSSYTEITRLNSLLTSNGKPCEEVEEFHTLIAPTLPTYSPHSPLHLHSQIHNQNKLSARYIHNKGTNKKKALVSVETQNLSYISQQSSARDTQSVQGSLDSTCNVTSLSLPKLASNLICSCEDGCFIRQTFAPKATNSTGPKGIRRLVATRNAATSPHLDVRKLGNMATVLANKSAGNKKDYNSKTCEVDTDSTSAVCKSILEKSNSLGESKPQKQLRTTRSLSPRPPIRHQQAIIVSDENEVVCVKLTPPSNYEQKTDRTARRLNVAEKCNVHLRKTKTDCQSEQTSPNITDFTDTKFAYNKLTNRSTGCLVYVPIDPWLRMADSENVDGMNRNPSRISKDVYSIATTNKNIDDDPWVKRVENDAAVPLKQERFRQIKSFSATKFDVQNSDIKRNLLRPKLRRCKSPLSTGDEKLLPLQSAPTSPLCLKSPENPFCSPFFLAYPHQNQNLTSPPRSASFSPARVKDTENPFVAFGSPTRSPDSISFGAVKSEQQPRFEGGFLDVLNPNLLQARHSFSSASNPECEEELPLSIRRLSEQMHKTQTCLTETANISLSDRTVNDSSKTKPAAFSISTLRTSIKGDDSSDYLAEFQNNESNKATITSDTALTIKGLTVSTDPASKCKTHDIPNATCMTQKSQTQTETLLETTC